VVSSWGSQGQDKNQFNLPRSIAKDHSGNIWVLDSGNSRIQIFSGLGVFISTWGSFGTSQGYLNLPLDFTLNFIDQSVLADTGNFRLQVFNDQGAPVTAAGWYGGGPYQFREPAGVVITNTGMVAMVDGPTGRVEFFNNRFEFISQWKAKDEILTPNYAPKFRGIAHDSQDRLYVTDIQNNSILRLRLVTSPDTPTPPTKTPTPVDNNPTAATGFPLDEPWTPLPPSKKILFLRPEAKGLLLALQALHRTERSFGAEYYKALRDNLPAPRKRILDFGSGVGYITDFLQAEGAEVEAGAVAQARKLYPKRKFHLFKAIPELRKLGKFDAVTCVNVAEHLFDGDRELLFKTLPSLLKPKGKILFVYDDMYHPLQIVAALKKPGTLLLDPTHIYCWTEGQFRGLLEKSFRVEKEIKGNIQWPRFPGATASPPPGFMSALPNPDLPPFATDEHGLTRID